MGNDEGRTSTALTQVVDMEILDDEGLFPEVRMLVTVAQMDKLAELLDRHVDLDVVELDNDDAEGARLVRDFLATWKEAKH